MIDLEEVKSRQIDCHFSAGSPARIALTELATDLYNQTPDPERPSYESLPEGTAKRLDAILRYVGESSVWSYHNIILSNGFVLATNPDVYSMFGEK